MPLQGNSNLITKALLRKVANNNSKDVIENEAGATAFSFTNEDGGLTGDDTISQFTASDSILNYKTIFDGNKDKIIDVGSNGMLDIDRTSSKSAGADQITLEGLVGGKLRYLGEKQGFHVYADASVRQAGFTEGTVGNDGFDASTAARTYFYDTALGLNLGGDTITGFGADDRIVTTTAFYNGGGDARAAVTAGGNGVFDLSGVEVNSSGDDGVANGGQIDLIGASALYLQSTNVVNGVTYYSYGTTRPAGNDAPAAPATSNVSTAEDTASAAVAIGARDPEGDTLAYSVKSGEGPTKGSISFDQAAGTFVYTPDTNANGADAFTLLISDGKGGTTEQRVSVAITPVNDAPTAAATASVTTAEDTATAAVAIGGSDLDGDTLSYSIKTGEGASKGSVTLDQMTGTFVYTPDANANGTDAFTMLVADGNGGTTEQRITVTIAPVNDTPAAAATASVTTAEDTASAAIAIGATDVDGDTLSYSSKTGNGASKGSVTLDQAAGTFVYTPNANASGTDAFIILVADGKGGTTEQRVTVTITPVNDAPTAPATKTVGTAEDTASPATAIEAVDFDGDELAYSVKTGDGPAKGSVALDQAGGTFIYTPNANANGADAFTILISDGKGGTTEQRVTVSIDAVNDAPTVPSARGLGIPEDSAPPAIGVGASDVEGDTLAYSVKAGSGPTKGSISLNQAAGTFTYKPNVNANGTDAFTIVVSDGNAAPGSSGSQCPLFPYKTRLRRFIWPTLLRALVGSRFWAKQTAITPEYRSRRLAM
jgi:VCBS repeat-containing protein